MLIDFFYSLRGAKLPVSREGISDAARSPQGAGDPAVARRVLLSRAHDAGQGREYFDKFDRAFGAYFHGVTQLPDEVFDIPLDWLKKRLEHEFTAEEKKRIEALGGLDKLMDRLKELMDEQKGRHESGNKWIGTGGTSPFGHGGYNPEGFRIGGESSGERSAMKVWDQRAYANYDDQGENRHAQHQGCAKAFAPLRARGRGPRSWIFPTRSAARPPTRAGST